MAAHPKGEEQDFMQNVKIFLVVSF